MQHECSSRDRLFVEYRQGVKQWISAINYLGKSSSDPHLMQRIEDARFWALAAKAHYKNHIADHGCEDLTPPHIHGLTLLRSRQMARAS